MCCHLFLDCLGVLNVVMPLDDLLGVLSNTPDKSTLLDELLEGVAFCRMCLRAGVRRSDSLLGVPFPLFQEDKDVAELGVSNPCIEVDDGGCLLFPENACNASKFMLPVLQTSDLDPPLNNKSLWSPSCASSLDNRYFGTFPAVNNGLSVLKKCLHLFLRSSFILFRISSKEALSSLV